MSQSREIVSLTEEDYTSVLDVITELLSHNSSESLAQLFQSRLLPLLDASACFYAQADSDLLRLRIIDAVGVPQSDFNTIQAYFPSCPLARHMAERASLVGTYDLDVPRQQLQFSVARFFEAHPAGKLRGESYLDDLRTTLLAIDHSQPAIVIEFHRLKACRASFTAREKRILELLRPHLCHAIRALVLKEGLKDRASPSEEDPMRCDAPTAEVTRDARVIDQNSTFGELFKTLPGDNLGSSLTRFLESRLSDYETSSDSPDPEKRPFGYCLCPSVFQVDITRRNDDLWHLELQPLIDGCPGFNPNLRHYGLTPKEKEICCRVRQGFDNREIASQLCISFHTAKTHLKNIYRKLGIPNRPRLVSFLNKQ